MIKTTRFGGEIGAIRCDLFDDQEGSIHAAEQHKSLPQAKAPVISVARAIGCQTP